MKLEASIQELHQLFLDMSVLVESQGELLDQIEFTVAQSVNYTGKAHHRTCLTRPACAAPPPPPPPPPPASPLPLSTPQAVVELRVAAKYQGKVRKKMCCVAITLLIILIVVLAPILSNLGGGSDSKDSSSPSPPPSGR